MEKRMDAVMTDDQVVRYTQLTARQMEIVMHSGASWRPEYGQELEEIDAELAALRQQLDAVKEARTENVPASEDDLLLDDMEHQQIKDEVRQAYLNGGRTGYLYDIDGNEYYTTRDGIRHYTRVEG